ncbi:MAG: glycogen debranching enzyme family protein [Acidobacteria bacterium]|nr:glycogen debranching enzyme family protein [Acidobacteriota bacterium]
MPRRELVFPAGDLIDPSLEWLVTNGLGGYASGPVRGGLTRRFHGLLIASLPAPVGRLMCLNLLRVTVDDGTTSACLDHEAFDALATGVVRPAQFTLHAGLPVWRYEAHAWTIDKRIVMPYGQNTTHVLFTIVRSEGPLELRLRPMFQIRPHEGLLTADTPPVHATAVESGAAETMVTGTSLAIRWMARGEDVRDLAEAATAVAEYPIEHARGYDYQGTLVSPGAYVVRAAAGHDVSFTVSTEPWSAVRAVAPADALAAEHARRRSLLQLAGDPRGLAAELTLAADQFIVAPVGRSSEVARARAHGEEPRSVIAGYHWFTDWGRDTMISLEGLALATGRWREAAWILRTFAHHVRDGLIPNMFPEGEHLGLYHTADASLWFFHAVHRYGAITGDRTLCEELRPALVAIAEHHVAGTRFGIAIDPADGLLRQGAEGYQLTWMDAKVGDWVVTPRRGKAVEINALWYNAMRLLARWDVESGRDADAARWRGHADRAAASFNQRFWNPAAGHLFDVIDGGAGDDPACRPNQLLAISLDHPVLDPVHWQPVLDVIVRELLTPVGLRTLSPHHPDYRRTYDGNLHARDAAYHQGTVWPWLIGPFIDAWRRAHPDDHEMPRRALAAFPAEMSRTGVGSLPEIFDAEAPFHARGCIAQAWSVAEVLRTWRLLRDASPEPASSLAHAWSRDAHPSR